MAPGSSMTVSPQTAVLLMAYGSAPSLDERDIRAYLTHILRFYRRASPSRKDVSRLRARYEAVGGSPLYDITARLVTATQRALDLALPGQFRVYMAMKHSPPYIEDRVRRIAEEGFSRAVGIALAPFRSRLSTDSYYKVIDDVNAELASPISWRFASDWHLHPLFLSLWQRRLDDALSVPAEHATVFTNHSLPARGLEDGDPYARQFEATAAAVAQGCGVARWRTAYQSAGGGGGAWLGPALTNVLAELIGEGYRSVLLAPVGFLMDHLEILYDLDVDAVQMGRELGVEVTRTRMPNDDPLFVAMLTELIRDLCPDAAARPAVAIP